ncbi:MAG: class II aldolase/adducin family protein [Mariprofundus sp.]|nr:class II aldolase/adducin family protein [Mariprofundus sp.]
MSLDHALSLRDELSQYYRWLRQYGYNDSHSGNISARACADEGDQSGAGDDHGGLVWLTPTGACADLLQPDDFVACRLDQPVPVTASGDAQLHLAIYRNNPKAAAIIHAHCPHAVALTLDGEDFTPPDFEGQLYFPRVRVITVPYDVYFEQAADQVAQVLSEDSICIVRGHGVYAWGETLNQAYKWTCSLEMSAKTAFIARQAGTI